MKGLPILDRYIIVDWTTYSTNLYKANLLNSCLASISNFLITNIIFLLPLLCLLAQKNALFAKFIYFSVSLPSFFFSDALYF